MQDETKVPGTFSDGTWYFFVARVSPSLPLHHLLKHFWILRGELGEDFSVELDVATLEVENESAIARPEWAHASVDADVPERAEIALLFPAIHARMLARLEDRFVRACHLRLSSPHEALRALEERTPLFHVNDSSFYAWHSVETLNPKL